MKRFILNLLTMILLTNVGLVSVSCGNDNNELSPDGVDYALLIPGHWADTNASEDDWVTMSIDSKGKGSIYYNDLRYADWGVAASGAYILDGNKLTAKYTNVRVEDENYNPTTYHGFTDGKSKTVVYTILSCDGYNLVLKDDSGKTAYYEKYKDID